MFDSVQDPPPPLVRLFCTLGVCAVLDVCVLQALFVSVLKLPVLTGPKQLCRWLAILNTVLTLMRSLFPESTLFSELK